MVSELPGLNDIFCARGLAPGALMSEYVAHVFRYEDLENPQPGFVLKKVLIVVDRHDIDPL